MLCDSHTHLNDGRFDDDRDAVIERAKAAGVSLIINPGADFESSQKAVALSERYDILYAAVGIHPHDAKATLEPDWSWAALEALTEGKKVVAIGEIGLDYYYDFSPRDVQKTVFRTQLRMAKALGLPVIIHDRDAHQDVLDILVEEQAFEVGVLMHCFAGSAELARQYVAKGAYLSLGGPITYKNARKSHEVIEAVSLDRLMIETDAPYLTPVPYRGKRNESAYVHYVCEKMAELKGVSYEAVAEATKNNALRFFKIDQYPLAKTELAKTASTGEEHAPDPA